MTKPFRSDTMKKFLSNTISSQNRDFILGNRQNRIKKEMRTNQTTNGSVSQEIRKIINRFGQEVDDVTASKNSPQLQDLSSDIEIVSPFRLV